MCSEIVFEFTYIFQLPLFLIQEEEVDRSLEELYTSYNVALQMDGIEN